MRIALIATPILAALLWATDHAPAPAQTTGLGQSVELVDPDVLRVCADPHNMPFSNEKEEGCWPPSSAANRCPTPISLRPPASSG